MFICNLPKWPQNWQCSQKLQILKVRVCNKKFINKHIREDVKKIVKDMSVKGVGVNPLFATK